MISPVFNNIILFDYRQLAVPYVAASTAATFTALALNNVVAKV